MDAKKYKVVCSQPRFSDKIYIDIAPENGVIHDQIFFSRIQLHRQTDNTPLERLYGSIYLQDVNGEITVEFPTPQARKNSPEYEGIQRRYAELKVKIVDRYNKMIAAGQESTLNVVGVNQMFELSEFKNVEAAAFERRRREKMKKLGILSEDSSYKEKHAEELSPRTPQEEKYLQNKENFEAVRKRRLRGEQKRSTETMPAWLRFQKQYSGD